MKKWIIYKHTNKITGKSYIGLTSQNPKIRFKNGKGYSSETQKKFVSAIKKYGWDNFEHTVIENDILSLELADEREKYWIAFYDSFNKGYNMTEGGKGNPGHKVTENQKKHHSDVMKKKKIVPWNKGLHTGISPWNKGTKMSKEYREKCRETTKRMYAEGKAFGGKNNKVAILQYDKNGNFIAEYSSIREAARVNNIHYYDIDNYLRGHLLSGKNFIWKKK